MRNALLVSALLLASQTPAPAAPAADVIGKSVTVTWTENRLGRAAGQPQLRRTTVDFKFDVYVSAAGRPFTRLAAASRAGVATNDQVGDRGASLGSGVRAVRVDGRSILLQGNFGNFARSLRIEVAQGGGSCSAQMMVGKEAGSKPTAFKNTAGNLIEIHELAVSGTACSIRQGNVFGH